MKIVLKLVMALVVAVAGCGDIPNQEPTSNSSELPGSSLPEVTKPDQSKRSNRHAIRDIDFMNFTYPWFPTIEGVRKLKKNIVMKNGENPLVRIPTTRADRLDLVYQETVANVSYADLTGDLEEEAIVTVTVMMYRWNPGCIFVFNANGEKPRLLWQYEFDSLKSGTEWRGLKVRDGKLVLELYDMKFDMPATCCPRRILRIEFAWNGKTLEEVRREPIPFDYSKGGKVGIGFPSDDELNK